MNTNPVISYMQSQEVGTVQMAELLGVSKGYVSQLKAGAKPVTPRIARGLERLTGRPWHEFVDEAAA